MGAIARHLSGSLLRGISFSAEGISFARSWQMETFLRLGQVAQRARSTGEREIRPALHLGIVVILAVPLGELAGGGKPDLAVTLGVANELAQEVRAKRPAADEGMVAPDHELGIGSALLIEAIEAVFPHLQKIPRRSSRPLVA